MSTNHPQEAKMWYIAKGATLDLKCRAEATFEAADEDEAEAIADDFGVCSATIRPATPAEVGEHLRLVGEHRRSEARARAAHSQSGGAFYGTRRAF